MRLARRSTAWRAGWFAAGTLLAVAAAGAQCPPGMPAEATLAEMDRVAAALLAWRLDAVASTPGGARTAGTATPLDLDLVAPITHADLAALLVPAYLPSLPTTDGWGTPYDFFLDVADPVTLPGMAVRSRGADGLAQGTVYPPGQNASQEEDIVWGDGLYYRRLVLPGTEQRATAGDLRAIAVAMVSWLVDQVARLPDGVPGGAGGGLCTETLADVAGIAPISHPDLASLLVPDYLPFVPAADAWGHPYEVRLDPLPLAGMAVRSPGADGAYSGTAYLRGEEPDPDGDLVWWRYFPVRIPPRTVAERAAANTADVRAVGTAMLSWLTDVIARTGSPPSAEGEPEAEGGPPPVDLALFTPIATEQLVDLLTPQYLACLPHLDPWGRPYDFWLDSEPPFVEHVMAMRSLGTDGAAEGGVYQPGPFPAGDLAADHVWADGFFVRWPDPALDVFVDGFESGSTCAWSETPARAGR